MRWLQVPQSATVACSHFNYRAIFLILIYSASCNSAERGEAVPQALVEFHRQLDLEQSRRIYTEADEEFRQGESQTGSAILGMLASNPAGVDFLNLGLNAVGNIPNVFGPTLFMIGVNGAGSLFAQAAFKPAFGTTGIGSAVLHGIGRLFAAKAIYDGVV